MIESKNSLRILGSFIELGKDLFRVPALTAQGNPQVATALPIAAPQLGKIQTFSESKVAGETMLEKIFLKKAF